MGRCSVMTSVRKISNVYITYVPVSFVGSGLTLRPNPPRPARWLLGVGAGETKTESQAQREQESSHSGAANYGGPQDRTSVLGKITCFAPDGGARVQLPGLSRYSMQEQGVIRVDRSDTEGHRSVRRVGKVYRTAKAASFASDCSISALTHSDRTIPPATLLDLSCSRCAALRLSSLSPPDSNTSIFVDSRELVTRPRRPLPTFVPAELSAPQPELKHMGVIYGRLFAEHTHHCTPRHVSARFEPDSGSCWGVRA